MAIDEKFSATIKLRPLSRTALRCELRLSFGNGITTLNAAKAVALAESSSSPLRIRGEVDRVRSMGHFTFADVIDGDERLQICVNASEIELSGGLGPLAISLLLRRHSRIEAEGIAGRTRTGDAAIFTRRLSLLALPAEPAAVLKAARCCVCSAISVDAAAAALGCGHEELYELVHSLEDPSSGDCGDGNADRLARTISAKLRSGGPQKARPPKFSTSEHALLKTLSSAHTEWRAEPCEELADEEEVSSLLSGRLAPEAGLPEGLGKAERETRLAYLTQKKLPQMRWMLLQARRLLDADGGSGSSGSTSEATKIVDLGCGKGDFTLLLASAMPSASVFGVDTNRDAVEAATARAHDAGLRNVSFACADARTVEMDGVRLLVALHACGGLSDLALELAARCGCAALVCTCCFNKHRSLCPATHWGAQEEQKDVLCRMADSVDDEVSMEARRVVSCMRLGRLRDESRERRLAAAIRTFPAAFSRQNVVLCARAA